MRCRFALPLVAPLLALLALLGSPPRATAEDDMAKRKADLILRLKVSRAIDAGAHWIARQQRADGTFKLDGNIGDGVHPMHRQTFGRTVLCFYTLADCDYAPDHAVMKKALAYLKKSWRHVMSGDYWPQSSSYSLALLVLGMHTLYVQPASEHSVVEHDRYGMRKKTKKNPCGYPTWVRRMIEEVLDWLMKNQADAGLFRYPGALDNIMYPGPEDLSNSQYVLLALWAGSRCGYEIPVEKLELMARRLIAWQDEGGEEVAREPDPEPSKPQAPSGPRGYAPQPPPAPVRHLDQARGFRYTPEFPEATGAMTTAGLSSLAIVKAMLLERNALEPALRKDLDQGMWDAIAWLVQRYGLRDNPGAGSLWHYYYLYGLERACVIAGKRFLGANDWYREGAEILVAAQEADGRWAPGKAAAARGGPWGHPYKADILDTCFALLFLKRATVKPRRPILDGPVTTPPGNEPSEK